MISGREMAEKLIERDGDRCALCGRRLTMENLTIDHVCPRRLGGSDEPENLQLLCRECNNRKSDRITDESEFEQLLIKMLKADGYSQNIASNVYHTDADGVRMIFDLTFTREIEGKEQRFIVEAKMMPAATMERVRSAVGQIKKYRAAVPKARFILAVPVLLAKEYRKEIEKEGIMLWDRETLHSKGPNFILPCPPTPNPYEQLLNRLRQCRPGMEDWRVYQRLVGEILEILFCPPLERPVEQNADGNYANRRDFIMPNYAENGYWRHLRERYQAEYVLVDAKNSGSPVTKADILQVAHYLKEKGLGMFGLIFSRAGVGASGEEHLQDIWRNEGKMLVILDDRDVEQMLLNEKNREDPCRLLMEKIQEFRQRM